VFFWEASCAAWPKPTAPLQRGAFAQSGARIRQDKTGLRKKREKGLLAEPATTWAVGRQLPSALTKEMELVQLVKHGELHQHQHDRRRESHRAVFQSSASVWVTAWPTPTCRMSNIQLAVHAGVWYMGVQVGLLQPMTNDRPGAPEGRSG
jgi:hypothetical protein